MRGRHTLPDEPQWLVEGVGDAKVELAACAVSSPPNPYLIRIRDGLAIASANLYAYRVILRRVTQGPVDVVLFL